MNTKRVLLLALCAFAATAAVVAQEAKQDSAPAAAAPAAGGEAPAADQPKKKVKKVKKAAEPVPPKEAPKEEAKKEEAAPPAPAPAAVKEKKEVTFADVTVRVTDASGLGSPVNVPYPSGLSKGLTVEKKGRVEVKFTASGEVDQLMVRLTNTKAGVAKTFATTASGTQQVAVVDLSTKDARKLVEGSYKVEILGAGASAKPTAWTAATVDMQTGVEAKDEDVAEQLKELSYTFQPDPTPPNFVLAYAFTALCASPFIGLLMAWGTIGVNLKGMKPSLSGLVFHASIAGVMAMFTLFWIRMSMFETLYYLTPITVVAFLSGNHFLKHHEL